MTLAINIAGFLLLQVISILFYKWGSLAPGKYFYGWIIGNCFGVPSILLLINVNKVLSPAATLAICVGGAFLLGQIALLICFREHVSAGGWCGLGLILSGILVYSFVR
ncbi:MAG: hypothetical protein PHS41_11625 [Victivallaceae bacterium]|nr:hypothetical protein [Victivallaceae bacterium]